MPFRRIILFGIFFGLLTVVLFSRYGARAQDLGAIYLQENNATQEIGEWLRLIKEPIPEDPLYILRGDTAEFAIVVLNTSENFAMQEVIVTDLNSPDCDREFTNLPPDGRASYTCVQTNVQEAFTNEAVVTGKNATNGKTDRASDTARVEVLELSVEIEPETKNIPSPGGAVQFSVMLTNLSSVSIKLDSLTSPQFGDLADPQNGTISDNTCTNALGRVLPKTGGSYDCEFTADVTGPAGDYTYQIDASGSVGNSATVSESGTTVVTIFDTITASLTAQSDKYATGSKINLRATIKNLSETTTIKILALEDADLGDVQELPGNCELPIILTPSDPAESTYSCNYEQKITAAVNEKQTFTLNVTAETVSEPAIPLQTQATNTVTVIEPILYLPVVTDIPRPTDCDSALRINTNTIYQSYPDIKYEYYKFVLAEEKEITVKITNFLASDGQVVLYRYAGEECISDPEVPYLAYDGTDNVDRTLETVTLPPGNYYVAVVNSGSLSVKEPYRLFIEAK